jgi:hypothetical protein
MHADVIEAHIQTRIVVEVRQDAAECTAVVAFDG